MSMENTKDIYQPKASIVNIAMPSILIKMFKNIGMYNDKAATLLCLEGIIYLAIEMYDDTHIDSNTESIVDSILAGGYTKGKLGTGERKYITRIVNISMKLFLEEVVIHSLSTRVTYVQDYNDTIIELQLYEP